MLFEVKKWLKENKEKRGRLKCGVSLKVNVERNEKI